MLVGPEERNADSTSCSALGALSPAELEAELQRRGELAGEQLRALYTLSEQLPASSLPRA